MCTIRSLLLMMPSTVHLASSLKWCQHRTYLIASHTPVQWHSSLHSHTPTAASHRKLQSNKSCCPILISLTHEYLAKYILHATHSALHTTCWQDAACILSTRHPEIHLLHRQVQRRCGNTFPRHKHTGCQTPPEVGDVAHAGGVFIRVCLAATPQGVFRQKVSR